MVQSLVVIVEGVFVVDELEFEEPVSSGGGGETPLGRGDLIDEGVLERVAGWNSLVGLEHFVEIGFVFASMTICSAVSRGGGRCGGARRPSGSWAVFFCASGDWLRFVFGMAWRFGVRLIVGARR